MRAEIKVSLQSSTADPKAFNRQVSLVLRMIENISLMTPDIAVKVLEEDKEVLLEGE